MSHAPLMRSLHGLRTLLEMNDPLHEPTIKALWQKIEQQVIGIPETNNEVITAENPWAFRPQAGTCFGGMYIVDEHMGKSPNVYKGHQTMWHDAGNEVVREVVIKCTFLEEVMDPVERKRCTEHEKRAVTVMGLEANNCHYSTETYAAGRLITPAGDIVLFWQVFEVMAGDLKQLHDRMHGKIPPYLLIRYFREICEALANIHAKGIVHRDIKPENILYAEGPTEELRWFMSHTKLTDAHLAEGTANDVTVTQAGTVCGTPQYMSPEQAHGSHNIGTPSDIWSLGVMMYYLCTGELPYSFAVGGGSHSSIPGIQFLQKMLAEDPKKFSAHAAAQAYPSYFISLVDSMLVKDSTKRPTAIDCVFANERAHGTLPIDTLFRAPRCLEKTLIIPPDEER